MALVSSTDLGTPPYGWREHQLLAVNFEEIDCHLAVRIRTDMRRDVPLKVRAIRGGTVNREGEGVGFVLLIKVVTEPLCEFTARGGQCRIEGNEHEIASKCPGDVESAFGRRSRMDDPIVGNGYVAWVSRAIIYIGQGLGDVMKCLRESFCPIG